MPTRSKNPLRVDPTRTATIRRQFASEIKKRFARLIQRIRELIVTEDAFGLRATRNERFRFLSDSAKVEAFRVWIAQQIAEGVIPATKPLDGDPEAYWDAYIQAGYRQGAGRAFEDVRPHLTGSLDFHAGTREEFLRTAFAQPVAAEKVKLLAGRTFADLKNVTDQMAVQLARVLADGLTQGQSPRDVARNLARQVGMSENRALTVARTETIRAHAEGQLDSLEKLGVEELGVMVEWSTAGDGRVCGRCAPLEGVVIKTSEARGLLPRHPNCRCAFLPAGLGEDTSGQKKSHAQVRKAIDKSIAAELPKTKKRTLAEQKKRTSWLGVDKRISKKRPKSILDDDLETKAPKKPKPKPKKSAPKLAETFGPSKARVRHLDYTKKEMQAGIDSVFGKGKKTIQDVASLVGAPDDAVVDVSPSGFGEISVFVEGDGYRANRRIYRDLANDKVTIKNEWFGVDKSKQGQGIGTRILGRQVEQASNLGVDRIVTLAAGNKSDSTLNGYYTWPRLGYDAEIPALIKEKLPDALQDAERVSDLMFSEEGRNWWKENGSAITLTFDLKSGSLSREVLDEYLKAKGFKK